MSLSIDPKATSTDIYQDSVKAATVLADGTVEIPKLSKASQLQRTWARIEYPNIISAGENIASVVRTQVGTYQIIFTKPFAQAVQADGRGAYAVAVSHSNLGGVGDAETSGMSTTGFVLNFVKLVSLSGDGRSQTDPNWFSVTVTGTMA